VRFIIERGEINAYIDDRADVRIKVEGLPKADDRRRIASNAV
jgi:hypothetical protein